MKSKTRGCVIAPVVQMEVHFSWRIVINMLKSDPRVSDICCACLRFLKNINIVEFWKEGRSRLGIKEPMTFIPLPIAWTLAYSMEFVYWYFQGTTKPTVFSSWLSSAVTGYVPATRSSMWNFTPKSLLYMVNDNSFGGQEEVEEGIGYKPLFNTNEMFDDILKEYKIAKGIE